VRPAERIALITESARLLATRDWAEMELVLRTHDIPTNGYDGDGPYPYALQMLQEAGGSELREVHSYLTGQDETTPGEPLPWEQGHLRLFMSHLAIQQEFVGAVGRTLSFEGTSAFVAHTSIEPSKEWMAVIETALRSCDAMVVFLHEGFHESLWCDQEVGFALARRVPVLILAIDQMPYGFMSKFQALKAKDQQAGQLAPQITNWLASTPTAQAAMTEGLITALGRTRSYNEIRRLLSLLESMPRFTPDQLEQLDRIAKTNQDVKDTNVGGRPAPDVVQALIVRHGWTPPPAEDPWGAPPF
jgi:hypothetical protein